MELLLLLGAIICWAVVAVLGFGWFGTNGDPMTAFGWLGLGLFLYGLYLIIPPLIVRRNPPA